MRYALLALLLAAPLSAQQNQATVGVEVVAPPAQVTVEHVSADTTVVLVSACGGCQVDAASMERGWVARVVDPLVDNWPWIGLGVAALWVFHKKDFGSTNTFNDGDVNHWPQVEGRKRDRRKDHHHD